MKKTFTHLRVFTLSLLIALLAIAAMPSESMANEPARKKGKLRCVMGRQVALAVLLKHEHPTDRKRAVRKLVVQKLPVPDRLLQIAIRIAIEERRHGNLHAIDPMFDLMTDPMVELMSKVQVEMDLTEVMQVGIQ
ncbi:MAG: hypothetical protein HOO17_07325, partial [Bacteroidetes Order II. Incertae sedis bacterium]|nr:hypothetical protein [Bacteroidetes Order II. bacterium]